MRDLRFDTAPPGQQPNAWQTVYAEASGYVPYQDPHTGFTRYDRLEIPTDTSAQIHPYLAALALAQGQGLMQTMTGSAAVASGIAAPSIPGVNIPNVDGQLSTAQVASIAGLADLIRLRAQDNPFAPAQQGGLAGAAPPGTLEISRLRQAVATLGDLIQVRAAQIQAQPALAGRVMPSVFNQVLQDIAGPGGANLADTNVPGVSNLFGSNTLQRNWALQQLEDIIRARAAAENLMAQPNAPQAGHQPPDDAHHMHPHPPQ